VSEGYLHGILVSKVAQYFTQEFGDDLDVLLVDIAGSRPSDKPPKIGNFFPDVWAQSRRRILLGEAKTAKDLDTEHSRAQIECFLRHVYLSPSGSRFVLAVPGFIAAHAKALVEHTTAALEITGPLNVILGIEIHQP